MPTLSLPAAPVTKITRETFYSLFWQSTEQRFRETVCAMAGLTREPCYRFWDDLASGVRARLRPEIIGLLEAHEAKRQEAIATRERQRHGCAPPEAEGLTEQPAGV